MEERNQASNDAHLIIDPVGVQIGAPQPDTQPRLSERVFILTAAEASAGRK